MRRLSIARLRGCVSEQAGEPSPGWRTKVFVRNSFAKALLSNYSFAPLLTLVAVAFDLSYRLLSRLPSATLAAATYKTHGSSPDSHPSVRDGCDKREKGLSAKQNESERSPSSPNFPKTLAFLRKVSRVNVHRHARSFVDPIEETA